MSVVELPCARQRDTVRHIIPIATSIRNLRVVHKLGRSPASKHIQDKNTRKAYTHKQPASGLAGGADDCIAHLALADSSKADSAARPRMQPQTHPGADRSRTSSPLSTRIEVWPNRSSAGSTSRPTMINFAVMADYCADGDVDIFAMETRTHYHCRVSDGDLTSARAKTSSEHHGPNVGLSFRGFIF